MFQRFKNAIADMKEHKDPYRFSRFLYIVQAALEYFIFILVTGAYLARLTRELGFSDSLTGILSSFLSLSGCFQLVSLFLFRRRQTIKGPLTLLVALQQLFFTFVYLVPVFPMTSGQKTWLFLIFFVTAYILQSVVTSPKTDWLMSLVPDRQRGSFTAKKEIVSLLGGMVFTYICGAVTDALEAAGNIRGAFIFGAAAMFGLMVLHTVTLILIREKPRETEEKQAESGHRFDFLKNKMLWKIILLCSLWYAASYVSTPFYGAYQINELGFSMTFVSVLSILYSIIRSLVSPLIGRYADRHSFSRSMYLCLIIAAGSFLVNCFTVPENGKVFFTLYYCLYAVSMAGVNSALINIVFDYIHGPERRHALAVSAAVSGLVGFLSTCAMSPVVDWIQKNGNRIFGIPMYPAQFCSIVAVVLTVILILYIRLDILRTPVPQEQAAVADSDPGRK